MNWIGSRRLRCAGVALVAVQACSLEPPVDHRRAGTDVTGWQIAGSASKDYFVGFDSSVVRGGKPTLRLNAVRDSASGYATWMNSVMAWKYRGKRVRITAYTRTADATQRADVWARVQGRESPADGPGLVGQHIARAPTSDWRRDVIVMDVPADGAWIQYGVGLAGRGHLWLDEPTFEVVGTDVPVTAAPAVASSVKAPDR